MVAVDLSTTLAAVVLAHPECAHVLRTHRLDYCCRGSLTIAEACVGKGLDAAALLDELAATVGTHPRRGSPDARDLSRSELIDCLRDAHRRSVRHATRVVGPLLLDVARTRDDELDELVDVFHALVALLKPHVEEEDAVLFPELLSRSCSVSRIHRDLHALRQEHFVIGDRLAYVRSLTDGFAFPSGSDVGYLTLMRELSSFDEHLRACVHLENHVLLARLAASRRSAHG